MRLKPSICAFIACWALVYAYPVAAQEGKSQPEMEGTTGLRNEPDPVISESESRNNKLSGGMGAIKETLRDSAQFIPVKPLKPIGKAAEKAEKEEDPLSFNFLYYIIEKFKMSDIIE